MTYPSSWIIGQKDIPMWDLVFLKKGLFELRMHAWSRMSVSYNDIRYICRALPLSNLTGLNKLPVNLVWIFCIPQIYYIPKYVSDSIQCIRACILNKASVFLNYRSCTTLNTSIEAKSTYIPPKYIPAFLLIMERTTLWFPKKLGYILQDCMRFRKKKPFWWMW